MLKRDEIEQIVGWEGREGGFCSFVDKKRKQNNVFDIPDILSGKWQQRNEHFVLPLLTERQKM